MRLQLPFSCHLPLSMVRDVVVLQRDFCELVRRGEWADIGGKHSGSLVNVILPRANAIFGITHYSGEKGADLLLRVRESNGSVPS